MLFRLLLLFLIVWFLLWILKKQFAPDEESSAPTSSDQSEDIIACHYCGIHAPKSSGLMYQGEFYCCREHAMLDEQEKS